MSNKQLIELIRAGKERGYSEQQLKEFLIKQGYKKEEIEEALRVVENNKNDEQEKQEEAIVELQPWIHSKSQLKRWLLAIGIFIPSFLFIAYSIGLLPKSIPILILILTYPIITYQIYKRVCKYATKNKRNTVITLNLIRFSYLSVLFLIIVLSILSEVYDSILLYSLLAIFSLLFIHSLFLYFNEKGKYPLELIFLVSTISITISLLITLLSYLIYAFFILSIFDSVSFITLTFILTFLIMLSLVVYLQMSNWLMKKLFVEYESSFDKNRRKNIIKLLIITFVISLIISSTIMGIFAFKFSRRVYKYIKSSESPIKDVITTRYRETLTNLMEQKVNTKTNQFHFVEIPLGLLKKDPTYTGRTFKKYMAERYPNYKEGVLVYNCDENLRCWKKWYPSFEGLKNVIDNISFNKNMILVKLYNKTLYGSNNLVNITIFLFPNENGEQIASYGLFLLEDPELQETKIAKEINEEWKNNYITTIKSLNEINIPEKWYKLILSFHNGKVLKDFSKSLTSNWIFNLKAGYLSSSAEIISQEYGWIKKNEINSTIFYDNTKNIDEQIARLKKSVNNLSQLYEQYLSKKHNEGTQNRNYLSNLYSSRRGSHIFDKASENLMKKLNIYQQLYEINGRIDSLRKEMIENITVQSYKSALKEAENPQVDKLEKALRLKLAETNLLSHFILSTQICDNEYRYRAMILESNYTKFCERILKDGLCSIPLNKSVICDLLLYKNK